MKKFKKVLFGYNKQDVDAAIETYEKIIKTNQQNIEYLKKRLKREEKQAKKEKQETLLDYDVIEDIKGTIDK